MSHDVPTTLPAQPLTASEERTWVMLAHLGGLLAFVGPLIVLLMQKDRSAAVAREARESLNFQISMAIWFVAALVLGTVLTFVVVGVFIMMFAPLIPLAAAVFAIVGAVIANKKGAYRYPLTIRFVR